MERRVSASFYQSKIKFITFVFDIEIKIKARIKLLYTIMSNMSMQDIDFLITPFAGSEEEDVVWWLSEFEEITENQEWADREKLVLCRKNLRGAAKKFIMNSAMRTYDEVKEGLTAEFKRNMCNADIYEQLQNTKMRNESFREYCYNMQGTAKLADVDETSLIKFIVNGVPGREDHKILLYGAKTVSELK